MAKTPKKRNKKYNPRKVRKHEIVYMTEEEFLARKALERQRREEALLDRYGPMVLTAASDIPPEQFTDIRQFLKPASL